jgi:hypothetical protein
MTRDGNHFLRQLASCAADSFEGRFCRMSTELHLAATLTQSELMMLYEAGFYATLCNISFNGLGGCAGTVKPERENNRIKLERSFMAASEALFASPGWAALSAATQASVRDKCLNVCVAPDCQAW